MTKLEKRVAHNKISHFVKTYPLILFFHTNNKQEFTTQLITNAFPKHRFSEINIRFVKNNVARKAIYALYKDKKTDRLLQGLVLVLGVENINLLENLLFTTRKSSSVLLLGAIYGNTVLNATQIKRLAHLVSENLVYFSLLSCLKKTSQIFYSISKIKSKLFYPILSKQKLFYSLTSVKNLKRSQTSIASHI